MMETIREVKESIFNKVIGFRNRFKKRLELDDLTPSRIEVVDQTGMMIDFDRRVHITYFIDSDAIPIRACDIEYGVKSGNIGHIHVDPEIRRRGLGEQMLDMAILDIRGNGLKEVYTIAKEGHPFWENVKGGAFKKDEKVSPGGGICHYRMKIQ